MPNENLVANVILRSNRLIRVGQCQGALENKSVLFSGPSVKFLEVCVIADRMFGFRMFRLDQL